MHKCENCLSEFVSKVSLQNHQNNRAKKCPKVILNPDGTLQNKLDSQCEYCYKVYSNLYNLNDHIIVCKKKTTKKSAEISFNNTLLKEINELKAQIAAISQKL